jgi:hypothetical protein
VFASIDANGSGSVSEPSQRLPPPPRNAPLFNRRKRPLPLARQVSRRELRYSAFASGLRSHWTSLNSNDDKMVSEVEWEEFWGDMYHLRDISMATEILDWLRFTYVLESWYP